MENPPTAKELPPAPLLSEPLNISKISRTRTTPVDLDTMDSSGRSNGRSSIDSTSERPKSQSGEAADTARAGPSGFSKLLRRKKNKKNQKQTDEQSTDNDRDIPGSRDGDYAASLFANDNNPLPENEAGTLLADDSELDRSLQNSSSNNGINTTSSPLIQTTSIDATDTEGVQADVESAVSGPSATASDSNPDADPSKSATQNPSTLEIPESRTGGKRRGTSPGRRFKNAFSSSAQDKKDTEGGRERSSSTSSKRSMTLFGGNGRRGSLSAKRAQTSHGIVAEPPPPLPPIRTDLTEDKPSELSERPRTPPHTALPVPAPHTTVTPPTPSEHRLEFPKLIDSPEVTSSPESITPGEGIVVSPSGNMISHRRVRSASSAHRPSKLSNSISVSPTIEEVKSSSRNPSAAQQAGFFSSMFSAAQNAASTLSSSLNNQPRNPSQLDSTTNASQTNSGAEDAKGDSNNSNGEEKRSLAIETLGSGDLDFSHLEVNVPPGGSVSTPDGIVITKPDLPPEKRKNMAVYQRDEEAAMLEVPPTDEPLELGSTTSLPKDFGGDQPPPSGDILDADLGTRSRRSPSLRGRLIGRHRGSSAATTSSTVGALAGAGAVALAAPGATPSVPRSTGFAVAGKKRNRDFHQLFRSVPEDDYLIEDYSCALQREIILAGRIYVSEGHICFSSNILGWVTTLVISFDEVVAIEKESTAMVFPNAIAIQTLHARHTFRSLLSRESTYDLMVNIWKINHPALKSSINGTRVSHGTGDKTEKAGESDVESDEDNEEDEIYDEDEDGDTVDSFVEAASVNGSEPTNPRKALSRQASGNIPKASANGPDAGDNGNSASGDTDFPGPATHAPTEYTDPNGQYDKVVKDEVIPAPLGKVYSLVFGPASGAFVPKFLVDNQKSGELQFSSEKQGLTNDSRNREYSYIKPLNGSIGPKQTKCISTEYLDFLDLEKAVLVTLTTQTPDVPSGNVFSVKTKYLFTWAAGNQTRFLMTCTIEWTGKSWLKGPIEKGAIDGQSGFGGDLIQAIKGAIAPRARPGTAKPGKGKGKRKKGDAAGQEPAPAIAATDATASKADSWGILEPLQGVLEPVMEIMKPLVSGNVAIAIIGILLFLLFFRTPFRSTVPSSHDIGCPGYTLPQRLAAYEEMWRREESELWSWLEDRVGLEGALFPMVRPSVSPLRQKAQQLRAERELSAKMSDDKMTDREMDAAIRTTRERLDALEDILNKRKAHSIVEEVQSRHEL
ncbi:GRAM and VASt domain-containing protein [Aspergillus chevalieri]|uniref:VASt domain-containing protein n=1 Tax=Aspergillus chevalieri TaxID=182096 RepID=A0A7R7ZKR6_ASPCH|nr:uncharacterized protein ACHE_20332S [Aspergillus chevalieri]BCR84874.1 hypothetical protein ACHE_20332S [Aspergillus chevalieri]